jgi:hypothetical protein
MDPHLRQRVLAIYAEADAAAAAAGPVCQSSGRCCRFAEYGHTLYISELEAEVLLATAPDYTQVTPAGCPFQVNNLCTAREERPLGCRVYFCDPSFKDTMPKIMETGIAQLKTLTAELGREWNYAPLHQFLGQALLAGRRQSLPVVNHWTAANAENSEKRI